MTLQAIQSISSRPSLTLDFAKSKQLDPRVAFSRASTGTYVGSDGLIKTAAVDVPRFDHDSATGESLGLLVEEQRANLLLNSGTLSSQSVTVTAASHTLSFYGTGTVTLSGASTAGPLAGTQTNTRVSLTFTPTAGTLTLTVNGTITNAQLEAGAFPTSYIPTTSSQVTRSADVVSITGANFSGWYNTSEGTMFVSSRNGYYGAHPHAGTGIEISAGSWQNNLIAFNGARDALYSPNGMIHVFNVNGLPSYSASTLGPIHLRTDLNKSYKTSFSYKFGTNATLSCSSDGQPTGSANYSNFPPLSPTTLSFGTNYYSYDMFSGTIQRVTYWPTCLSNTTLQTLST